MKLKDERFDLDWIPAQGMFCFFKDSLTLIGTFFCRNPDRSGSAVIGSIVN